MSSITTIIKTYIIYILASLLVGVIASHVWVSIQKNALNHEVDVLNQNIITIQGDVTRATHAYTSCKKSIDKLVEASVKKQKTINRYRKALAKGETHEKINNVNDFINYANGLQ